MLRSKFPALQKRIASIFRYTGHGAIERICVFLVLIFFLGGESGEVGGARQVMIRMSNGQEHGGVGAEVCAALALGALGGVCGVLETQTGAGELQWTWVLVAGHVVRFEDVTTAAEEEVAVRGSWFEDAFLVFVHGGEELE
jgi:hypothetical protein